jgi:glycosyltransferase involved in cell wall biosynthesis
MNNCAVLIPVYNNGTGILSSIASINKDEYIDIVIVDDGSKTNLINEFKIKHAFKANGAVVFLKNTVNVGIEKALNYGLQYIINANYKYTARLDAGDICLGMRFRIQEEYLKTNIETKLLGSNASAVDMSGKEIFKYNFPLNHQEIIDKIYINAVFVHPTIMFCNDILEKTGLYPTKYLAAEDYGFTLKIARKYKVENLSDCLVQVELNPNGISISRRKTQIKSRIFVIVDNFYLGFNPLYGLIRNIVLYIAPDNLIYFLKNKFVHKK